MNERIRELSAITKNLATDEAINLSRALNRTLSLDEEQEIFTKKFAELIVKECAELCANIDGGENMFSRAIRREFGVE